MSNPVLTVAGVSFRRKPTKIYRERVDYIVNEEVSGDRRRETLYVMPGTNILHLLVHWTQMPLGNSRRNYSYWLEDKEKSL